MELGNSIGYTGTQGYYPSHARSLSGPSNLASPIPRAVSSPAGGITSEPFPASDFPPSSSFQSQSFLKIRSHPPSPNFESIRLPVPAVYRPPIPLNPSESSFESPLPGSAYNHVSTNAPTSPSVVSYDSPLPRHYSETYPHHQQPPHAGNGAPNHPIQQSPAMTPHSHIHNGATTSTSGAIYSNAQDLVSMSHQERFDLAYNSMSARGRPGPIASNQGEEISRAGWAPSPANGWYDRRD